MATLTLTIFCILLIICIATNHFILYALFAGLVLFSFYSRKQGYTWKSIGKMILQGIKKVRNILFTFILIGMLTALWRQAGTIPAIICYTIHLITPSTFLLMTFLLNCLVSVLTGTSFGTAATMGVVCATIASTLGIRPWMAGGAILSGIYFGDRCSPVSTSALLVSELTGTSVYRNIRNMIRSGAVPFIVTALIYFCVSRNLHGTAEVPDLVKIFGNEFQIGWITLLPAVVILVLSVMQAGVKISMIASILTAIPICIWFQGIPVKNLSMLILTGFHSADSAVASMLDGGGISSMVKVGAIVCISSSYSGIFQETGILDGIQKMVIALADKTKPYLAVFVTAVLTGVVACNQTLSIILTDQLCSRTEADKEKFANYLEDSAVVIAPLIPWSIAGAVPLAAVGAPESSVLFALFLYLLPLWDLLIKK